MQHKTPRDELIDIYMNNRAQTSTRDTTGAAMAIAAADVMIAECGSPEAALAWERANGVEAERI